MSEKIKGMFGNQERAEEVKNWLKSQGAVVVPIACTYANHIYYVREDGCVDYIHETYSELFDIVKLPEPPQEFKPFDKVLVRDRNDQLWRCDFYSHKQDEMFLCVSSTFRQCIPYEGNEHLVGTSNNPMNE